MKKPAQHRLARHGASRSALAAGVCEAHMDHDLPLAVDEIRSVLKAATCLTDMGAVCSGPLVALLERATALAKAIPQHGPLVRVNP